MKKRTEKEIFNDIEELCLNEGYIYVLAWFCLRDDMIIYSDQMQVSDMEHTFSPDRLIRTEISTLAGLMSKGDINLICPPTETFQQLVVKTDTLLKELHSVFYTPVSAANLEDGLEGYLQQESIYREAFFYSGEPAYHFQFRDLAHRKYLDDNGWFEETKSFSVFDADLVIKSICSLYQSKVANIQDLVTESCIEIDNLLGIFKFSIDDIASDTGLDSSIVRRIVHSFCLESFSNVEFEGIHDFNEYNAKPLISLGEDKYVLFQLYSITEAFYESPFYWMLDDKEYIDTAMENRGNFTENYSAERLTNVFGKDRVYKNVNISASKKEIAEEIDVLVVFADRAIILQAKSKKLTLESKKGNDKKIKDDFKKSIQDSYDQGYACAKLLNDDQHTLYDENNNVICEGKKFSEIYIFCVILDSYPALSFQVGQFLKYQEDVVIQPPFIMDVFFLDVISEMLTSPLRFLSYVNAHAKHIEKVSSTHELTILSFHLKQNLYVDGEADFLYLHDDISSSLDLAMMVRRDDVDGADTPNGILTRFKGTTIFKLLEDMESEENEAVINLGFLLLTANEDTINVINNGLDTIIEKALKDGANHDFGIGIAGTGITFHCNNFSINKAQERLIGHCEIKKYSEKSDEWFGLIISPRKVPDIRFGLHMKNVWEHSSEMDKIAAYTFGIKKENPMLISHKRVDANAKRKRKRKTAKHSRRKNR